MKTATVPAIVKIEADLRGFRPVDETLASNLSFPQPITKTRIFGTTDIWNCRRQRRFSGVAIR